MADKTKLDLHQIVAFTRLLRAPVFNPGGTIADTPCPCNSKCGCNDKPDCCEMKCGCDGDTSRGLGEEIERTISTLSDPKYSAILESFDPGNVKTITDFINLATQARAKVNVANVAKGKV